jgi:hypothetical protein
MIGATGSSAVHRALGSSAFVAVGLISYSLYLWHWPVLAFIRGVYAEPALPAEVAILAIVLSVAMATLSWRYVERPFRVLSGIDKAAGKARGMSRRATALFSLGGMGVLGALAGLVMVGDGLPQRVSVDVLAIAADATPTRFDLECMQRYTLDDACRIGVPTRAGDPVDLVLIGDSHAAAAAEAVDLVAREAGLSGAFLGNVSCAPLLGVIAGTPDERANCRHFMAEAVAFIRTAPGLEHVVLVARWPVLAEGVLMPGEPGNAFPVRLDPSAFPDAPTHTTNAEALRTALQDMRSIRSSPTCQPRFA